MTTTVREFSMYGPCIDLGELVKQTPNTVWIKDRHGEITKRGGRSLKNGLIHLAPCPSCRDHAHTPYPNGYDN